MGNTEESRNLPAVLSLCSGYGGLERGMGLAGVKHTVAAYVEIEAFAIANLVAKMESGELGAAPIWTDIKTFPAHLFRGAIDIITGGYPCQPFSAAGKRLGANDPRHLWPFIWSHVNAIAPDRVFFENVDGHISMGLSTVVSDLEGLGYKTTWGVFSAAEVGAPHQRKRVYIMGDAEGRQANVGGPGSVEGQTGGGQSGNPAAGVTGSNGAPGPQDVADRLRPRLQGHAGHGDGSDQPGRQPAQAGGPAGPGGVCPRWAEQTGRITVGPLGGPDDGFAGALDGIAGELERIDADIQKKDFTREILQMVPSAALSETVQRAAGGFRSVHPKKILWACLCGVQDEPEYSWVQGESELLRVVWHYLKTPGASLRPRCGEQHKGKYSNALYRLSRNTSPPFPEAWASGVWEDGVERVTTDEADRVDRIRLLGNGVVPQTAAKAYITLDEELRQ